VAEFVENHNYYAKLYGADFGNVYLDQNAEWAEKEPDGTAYLEIGYAAKKPEYRFTVENGYIKGVSFAVEIYNNEKLLWAGDANTHMLMVSFALAGAQDGTGLFSNAQSRIGEQIKNNAFHDFQFTEAGLAFTCDVEHSGYNDTASGVLFPEAGAAEGYFRLEFFVNK
jgi:hypothetical protein